MKTIHCIGNYNEINPNFWNRLVQFYESKNYKIEPYDYEKRIDSNNILLLLNPFDINDYYYDIHLLWVAYFKKNPAFREVKIIISGFSNTCSAYEDNYISFIDYEEKFDNFIQNLKEIKNLSGYTKKDVTRANIIKALLDFFKGHNDRSLFQEFNYLEMALKNILYTTTGDIDRSFEYGVTKMQPLAKEKWKVFESRWQFYKPFLKSTPFQLEGNEIDKAIKFLNVFLKQETASKEITTKNIKKIVAETGVIRHNLNEMSKYVQ